MSRRTACPGLAAVLALTLVGSAFVPRIADPRARVFEYALGGRGECLDLPLP